MKRNTARRTVTKVALALLTASALVAAACTAAPETPVGGPDKLLAGDTLRSGESIASENGYTFTMDVDGNAVVRSPAAAHHKVLWSSSTGNNPGATITLQTDGNLVVRSVTGTPLWQNTAHMFAGSYIAIGSDGNLVQYQPHTGGRREVWSTGTSQIHPDRTAAGCPGGPNHALCAKSVTEARSNTAARAIKVAFAQLGKPYSTANRLGPNSYDCSGLVWRAYFDAGIDIGARTSATIVSGGGPRTIIGFGDAKPGDPIWYPGHIAIKLSDGQMIEAARPGTNVRVVKTAGRSFSRAVVIAAA